MYQTRIPLLYPRHVVQSALHRRLAGRLFVGFF
jgi:hypothetical protein